MALALPGPLLSLFLGAMIHPMPLARGLSAGDSQAPSAAGVMEIAMIKSDLNLVTFKSIFHCFDNQLEVKIKSCFLRLSGSCLKLQTVI